MRSAVLREAVLEATAVQPAHTCVCLCVAKCYVCMLLHNVQQQSILGMLVFSGLYILLFCMTNLDF